MHWCISGSLTDLLGVQLGSNRAILYFLSVWLMIEKQEISEPVPEVVLMASWGMVLALVALKAPSKVRTSWPSWLCTSLMALQASWELPPPRLMMPSNLPAAKTLAPAMTSWSLGLGVTLSNTVESTPAALSTPWIVSTMPVPRRPVVTIRALVIPSALASLPTIVCAPQPPFTEGYACIILIGYSSLSFFRVRFTSLLCDMGTSSFWGVCFCLS